MESVGIDGFVLFTDFRERDEMNFPDLSKEIFKKKNFRYTFYQPTVIK